MIITNNNIEFNNVNSAMSSINDTEKTINVKIDENFFMNINSKGDFRQINSTQDLKDLHKDGLESAKNTFAIMNG
jgi:hypothetical protein